MTPQVKTLFQTNVELLEIVDKAIVYFREQDYPKALEFMPEVSNKMRHVIDGLLAENEYFELVSTDSLMEMLEGIVEASKAEDYVLLADLLELQLCTLLCNVQELIMKKEDYAFFSETMYREQCEAMSKKLAEGGTNQPEELFATPLNPEELLEQGYRVEVTSCGLMTVAVATDRGSVYLHSNNKVGLEAFLVARGFARQDAQTYLVKGFGMGYHVAELAKQKPDAKIEVYESDGQILKLACAFSPLKKLLENENISICYDEDGAAWHNRVENLADTEAVCLHMPSVQAGSALFSLRR
ncbi:MAG: hypothetical protein IJ420_09130 [Lachnospiraceae bacterium]|nr:hypothetical protein [Lachnospiraceae bacterium]MBQ7863884.1 hypothetical protein [Lachnospiraceae bacterium]MBQ8633754.1 hypothetical protein [Lachnospiraceae bacterium]MBQ8878434.1 hypothetical protein [Lachnospiraceae bacterium]